MCRIGVFPVSSRPSSPVRDIISISVIGFRFLFLPFSLFQSVKLTRSHVPHLPLPPLGIAEATSLRPDHAD